MVRWVAEQSVGLGRVQWLGLFDQPTQAECISNLYNQDACNVLCLASGITGYGAALITPCTNQCLIELCGKGIIGAPLITPVDMQKAVGAIGGCLSKCVADANKLEDPTARSVALQACPLTCNLALELSKVRKAKAQQPGTPPTTKSPPSKASAAGIAILAVLAIAAVTAAGALK